jgi:putative FmdB family regulatory protein
MPAYEYQCDSCDNRFEARQKMSEPALDMCPRCRGHVRRLISGGAGAISKGSSPASSYMQPQCDFEGGCCGGGCAQANGSACEV